jgi:hypothetical protein
MDRTLGSAWTASPNEIKERLHDEGRYPGPVRKAEPVHPWKRGD